jgi:hypothetical protein
VVVGVSCGLDYRTAEATHPRTGKAVREAQRAACLLAVKAAVAAGLNLVVECHDAPMPAESPSASAAAESVASSGPDSETDPEPEPKSELVLAPDAIESAAKDLLVMLIKTVPPSMTILLRCGSLTTAPKPGLAKLLQVWPKLYVGLSASLTYAKCPRALLNVAYDLPLEKLVLTSEAPTALPSVLGGAKRTQVCVPPHVACVAEQIATIKAVAGLDREAVLRRSTQNLCEALGLPVPVGVVAANEGAHIARGAGVEDDGNDDDDEVAQRAVQGAPS